MSNTPTTPPGNTPAIPPYWSKEEDWIVLVEFLRRDDDEDRMRGAEAIGYMLAYAQMTDTRMLALVGDPKEDAYELLFSFSSPWNKAEFLRLLQSNDATNCEDNLILVPRQARLMPRSPSHECFRKTSCVRQLSLRSCCLAARRRQSNSLCS